MNCAIPFYYNSIDKTLQQCIIGHHETAKLFYCFPVKEECEYKYM